MNVDNIEDIYELSPMQQGMLFHSLDAPESGVYCSRVSYTLSGNLDVSAFERAWQQVVDRHPVLRTSFYWEELEKPLQVVHRYAKLLFEFQDWQKLSPTEQESRLQIYLKEEGRHGFKLMEAPLIRLALFQYTEGVYQFVVVHHHMLLDGWCKALLFKEVFDFYEAFRRGQNIRLEQPRPFRDYIIWLQKQDRSKAGAFWREELQGFTAPTPLEIDRASGSLPSPEEDYNELHIQLSGTTTAQLQSLARMHHLTLNTFVQGAWAMLLSRYSSEEDVVFGATVSGRPTALTGAESMIGLFINTLPVRVLVWREATLLPWLQELQTHQAQVRQYDYSPLMEIQGCSEVPRRQPLFESIVVFENTIGFHSPREQYGSLEIIKVRPFIRNNYPLTVRAVPSRELSLDLMYECCRFDAATIAKMANHFETLLGSIITQPDVKLKRLGEILDEEDRQHQIIKEKKSKEASLLKLKTVKRKVVRGSP
jgi:hypothetical protein